jgi:NAD(P)-dependent dehydrogenase (short-subunit alcohol dehydrogenase family)
MADDTPLRGKTIVMTGATSGIGEVAAMHLAARGARLVLVARDPERAARTLKRLTPPAGAAGHGVHLADLSVIGEMKRVGTAIAAAEPHVDLLINNAGAVFMGRERTVDGLGATFATNHLPYYVLTLLLLPRLRATPSARIVCTASNAHTYGKFDLADLDANGVAGYARSKLANLLFVRRLAQLLGAGTVTINAHHPGFVATRIAENTAWLWRTAMRVRKAMRGLTPEEGARTLLYLAEAPELANCTGGYYVRCALAQPAPQALNDADALALWRLSAQLTGLDLPPRAA